MTDLKPNTESWSTLGYHFLIATILASLYYDGHFTLLCFSTKVKFGFGTITDRDEIEKMSDYDLISDAITNAIQQHIALKTKTKN
jgi:hypothetical protein